MKVKLAAIRASDGLIFIGRRHHEIFRTLEQCGYPPPFDFADFEQGFVLADGSFADRVEAARIAASNGQIKEPKSQLFSEDLY